MNFGRCQRWTLACLAAFVLAGGCCAPCVPAGSSPLDLAFSPSHAPPPPVRPPRSRFHPVPTRPVFSPPHQVLPEPAEALPLPGPAIPIAPQKLPGEEVAPLSPAEAQPLPASPKLAAPAAETPPASERLPEPQPLNNGQPPMPEMQLPLPEPAAPESVTPPVAQPQDTPPSEEPKAPSGFEAVRRSPLPSSAFEENAASSAANSAAAPRSAYQGWKPRRDGVPGPLPLR